MHVGLNLVYLVPGATGGTETYARELIPELAAAAPDTRFTAFINREAAVARGGPWGELIPAITVPVEAASRVQWVRGEQQLLPPLARRAGIDVLHSLANTAPAWGRFRRVVTIHDLMFKRAPEAHLGLLGRGMGILVPLAARRAHRIITVSGSAADDVRQLLAIPSSKIDVVPSGTGTAARSEPLPEPEIRRVLGAGERQIVLTASALRPHKNLARLIGAIAGFEPARRPLLVLAGYRTDYEKELQRCAEELGVSDSVRILGWVDQPTLEGLYAACGCFALPSLYEGFGLPVLEAMARGVPVVCSDRGALAEVAGDAAISVDPESVRSIAAGIERLLSDPAEADRLRARGRERASRFTWAAAAAGTLVAYERALGSLGATPAGA